MGLTAGASWRVLVTRPQPGAFATAERLRTAGFDPVVLPLSETVALPAALPKNVRFDAVAATSAQALRWAEPALVEALRAAPFLAVGERTGSAARAAGFSGVTEAGGDAAALARLILARPSVRTLFYLCGRLRRSDFEAALQAGGVSVVPVEVYDTEAAALAPSAVALALDNRPLQAALLYSALAAQAYGRLLDITASGGLLRDALPLALSQRILEGLPPGIAGFAASEPNEASLFALLAELRATDASFQPTPV